MCRWKGFTAEIDSPLPATILLEDCPDVLLQYIKNPKTDLTPELVALADTHFPTRSKADLETLPAAEFADDSLLRNTPHRLARTARDGDAPAAWATDPAAVPHPPAPTTTAHAAMKFGRRPSTAGDASGVWGFRDGPPRTEWRALPAPPIYCKFLPGLRFPEPPRDVPKRPHAHLSIRVEVLRSDEASAVDPGDGAALRSP